VETTVKDLQISLELEAPFIRLTIGGRACATSALLDDTDLDRLSRIFADHARKLRDD
jgi:hypothetical protein